jgi:hypothetical protein
LTFNAVVVAVVVVVVVVINDDMEGNDAILGR